MHRTSDDFIPGSIATSGLLLIRLETAISDEYIFCQELSNESKQIKMETMFKSKVGKIESTNSWITNK